MVTGKRLYDKFVNVKIKIIFTAIRFCVDTFVLYFDTSIKHFH